MKLLTFGWRSHPPHTYRDEHRAICLDKVRTHLKRLPPESTKEQRATEVAKEFDLAYDQSVRICEHIGRIEIVDLVKSLRDMSDQFERKLQAG